MLKFGVFNNFDLALFATGIGVSFLLMMILPVDNFVMAIMAILPGLVCGFLVIPIPNYHNVRTVIKNAWEFFTTRQRYVWRGWCFDYGKKDKR